MLKAESPGYTGVVGAFLYVLGCREPLPGLHERYVAARWRQALGSAMHRVAGDGVGILAGGCFRASFLAGVTEMILEYILGFAFGWTIFQALFMRDMAGVLIACVGEHIRSRTRVDEFPHGGNVADHDGTQAIRPVRSAPSPAKVSNAKKRLAFVHVKTYT